MSIERVQQTAPERAVDPERIAHWAKRFTASPLLPKHLVVYTRDAKGKTTKIIDPDATALGVELVALKGAALGLEPAIAIDAFNVIDGSVVPTAKTVLAAVEKAGYRVWWPEYSSERVTVAARMPGGGPDEVTRVTFTMDDARRAGLLDEWFERWEPADSGKSYKNRWVVGSSDDPPAWVKKLQAEGVKPTRRENWWKWPIDMLVARVSVRLGRLLATFEMSGGIRVAVEALEQAEKAEDFDSPVPASAPRNDEYPVVADVHGEIADAELVPEQEPPASEPEPAESPSVEVAHDADEEERLALAVEVAETLSALRIGTAERRAVWFYAIGRELRAPREGTLDELRAAQKVLQDIEVGEAEVVNGPEGWVVEGRAA